MSEERLATDEAKTALEDRVTWYLGDKLQAVNTVIATKKYLTSANLLVYLTRCNIAELSVPRIKIQILNRVKGGVHETGYQLFGDHRLEKYQNEMLFGTAATAAPDVESQPVAQAEAETLLKFLDTLQSARQLN